VTRQTLWLALSLASVCCTASCDAVCPAAFDPSDNPVGQSCEVDADCEVECVCQDPNGKDKGMVAGDCFNGTCSDAHDVCEGACGARDYAGKFCEIRR
jgi:hypothetical protein